jgi:hypothetical protein
VSTRDRVHAEAPGPVSIARRQRAPSSAACRPRGRSWNVAIDGKQRRGNGELATALRDQRQLRARHSLLPGEPARDGLSARRRPRGRAPSPRPRRRPSKRPANSAGPEPALVRACCVYGQGQGRLGHPAARRTTRDRPVPTRRRSRSPRTPGGGGVEADVATDYGELSGSAAQRCRAPGTAASGHRESAGLRHGGLADARD